MLDGMPLIDVHLHAARLPTLKLPRETWLQGFAASATMVPQLGAGTCTPKPRNASPDVRITATAATRVACTTMGPRIRAMTWRRMICQCDRPLTRAASM